MTFISKKRHMYDKMVVLPEKILATKRKYYQNNRIAPHDTKIVLLVNNMLIIQTIIGEVFCISIQMLHENIQISEKCMFP